MSAQKGELSNSNSVNNNNNLFDKNAAARRFFQHFSKYREFYANEKIAKKVNDLRYQTHSIKFDNNIDDWQKEYKVKKAKADLKIYEAIQAILKNFNEAFKKEVFAKLEDQSIKADDYFSNKLIAALKDFWADKPVDLKTLNFNPQLRKRFIDFLVNNEATLKTLNAGVEELENLIDQSRLAKFDQETFNDNVQMLVDYKDFFSASNEDVSFYQFIKDTSVSHPKIVGVLKVLSKELRELLSSKLTYVDHIDVTVKPTSLVVGGQGATSKTMLIEDTPREYFKQLFYLDDDLLHAKLQKFLLNNPHIATFFNTKSWDFNQVATQWSNWSLLKAQERKKAEAKTQAVQGVVSKSKSFEKALEDISDLMIQYRSFFSYVFDPSVYHGFIMERDTNLDLNSLQTILMKFETLMDSAEMIKGADPREEKLDCFRKFFQVQDDEKLETILENFLNKNEKILRFLDENQAVLRDWCKTWDTWFKSTYENENDNNKVDSLANVATSEEEI
jgi:hypothetical protein